MELTITELDNLGENNFTKEPPIDSVNFDSNKYWKTHKKTDEQKKKVRFSYGDILSSMNLVVNQNGALQYMTPINNEEETGYDTEVKNMEPQMKNSYIFNKYFKDYKEQNVAPQQRIPKTIEEYRQMVIEDHIKRVEAQKRIQQIKSKKMFFSQNMPSRVSQKVGSMNQFFRK